MKNATCSLLLSAAILISVAAACQVPVFRYALERWPADNYEFIVVHDQPLSQADQKYVEQLRRSSRQRGGHANHAVALMPADRIDDPMVKAYWSMYSDSEDADSGRPMLMSRFPRSSNEVPDPVIDAGPLGEVEIALIADSPVRRTIRDRLVEGESAVWIFVPSGDPSQDDPALDTLTRVLDDNQRSLELPEQEEITDEKELLEQVDIELKLDFSVVTLDRNDPEERFLLRMLLASEPDLEELDQPMAFPVLGRGRVLYALVGRGISELTITTASRFIIGPCSCQVKNQNPGFDLLMDVDWDRRIGKTKLSDPLPELNEEPVLLQIPPGRKRH